MKRMIFLVFVCAALNSTAFAYVENVTHGYANCTACHVSPSGGGVLTDYGRSLSKELMSTWGWEGSERPLFGLLAQGERLKIGGHVRAIQTHFENRQARTGRFFLMQQNLELAWQKGKTFLVGAFGTQEGPESTPEKGNFVSERHYALHELAEGVFVRGGKFRLPFGINDPNHRRMTKHDLGFGSNSESYNLEVVKFTENSELFLGTSLGAMDLPREGQSEKSFYMTYARTLSEKNKLGVSFLLGESPSRRRNLLSAFGILAFGEKIVLVSELASQFAHVANAPGKRVDGLFTAHRLMYEAAKGLKPYVLVEAKQADLGTPETRSFLPGLGVQWLPLPHLELQAEYQRVMTERTPGNPADTAFILTHFYF